MPLNRLTKNNKGVTLVEVIAVIAVLGVVMAAVTGFMVTGAKMSAKVSNEAKFSIREQTAVEFINQKLLGAKKVTLDNPQNVPVNGEEKQAIISMTIDGATLAWDMENSKVTYNGIELCKGTIYFTSTDNGTVVYHLNGTAHVVHLRAGIVTSGET